MKKTILTVLLGGALVLSLTACGSEAEGSSSSASQSSTDSASLSQSQEEISNPQLDNDEQLTAGSTQLPNPIVPYDTLEAAQEALDSTFAVPLTLPEGYTQSEISVINGTVAQVVYQKGEDVLTYRTGEKTGEQTDISGDYTIYPESQEVTVGEQAVTFGGESGMVSLAQWEQDGWLYTLQATPALPAEQMTQIIESVA